MGLFRDRGRRLVTNNKEEEMTVAQKGFTLSAQDAAMIRFAVIWWTYVNEKQAHNDLTWTDPEGIIEAYRKVEAELPPHDSDYVHHRGNVTRFREMMRFISRNLDKGTMMQHLLKLTCLPDAEFPDVMVDMLYARLQVAEKQAEYTAEPPQIPGLTWERLEELRLEMVQRIRRYLGREVANA